jgi:hypothetical protein
LRRFEQEATAAAALNHPNILAVHQPGTYAGTPYLVSELLEGETLREQIRRGRKAAKVSYNSRHRGSAMKTLGLCFLLVPVILIPGAFAQEQSKNSQISADDAIVQLWNAHSDQTEGARLEGDKLIISSDSDLNTCLYLRVYRVKREAKKSDVTVPSGYTTCVPVNRFNKKSAEMPKLRFLPQQ